MPKLQIALPDGTEITHELSEDVVTIGRISENTIEIDDASVSSHHAVLTSQGKDYVLKDLGSTNGTRLNGKTVAAEEAQQLQDGDTLAFGKIGAIYSSDIPSETRPMPVEEQPTAVAAESSVRPADFSNASPFQKKNKKKDPTGVAVMVFAVIAILVFLGAMAMVMGLQAPSVG
jgi:pSer/pThr/pTyr-binding forkhead associated (FHA) protein